MNYQKVYNQIVERAKLIENERVTLKKQGSYFERHHIVPKCLGGLNSKENLILLTAREHFLCHWLLIRIYPNDKKLIYSFWGLCNGFKSKFNQRIIPSSRIYEESRILLVDNMICNYPNNVGKKKMYSIIEDKEIFIHSDKINDYILLGYKLGCKPRSELAKKNSSIAHIGKSRGPMSDITKQKQRVSHLGKIKSKETKEKIRLSKIGFTHSLKSKEKCSNSIKEYFRNNKITRPHLKGSKHMINIISGVTKRVKIEEINNFINKGYKLGRTL